MVQIMGEISGLLIALYATAGETNVAMRPLLMEKLAQETRDTGLTLPIEDAQLDLLDKGRKTVLERMNGALLRAMMPPDVRKQAGMP